MADSPIGNDSIGNMSIKVESDPTWPDFEEAQVKQELMCSDYPMIMPVSGAGDSDAASDNEQGVNNYDISEDEESTKEEFIDNENLVDYPKHELPGGLCYKQTTASGPDAVGVFTTTSMPKNKWFGPYVGKSVEDISNSRYYWPIFKAAKGAKYICADDENDSNWMRWVKKTDDIDSQNTCMVQHQCLIFYKTCTDLAINEELLLPESVHDTSAETSGLEMKDEPQLELNTDGGVQDLYSSVDNKQLVQKKRRMSERFNVQTKKRYKCEPCSRLFMNWTSHRLHVLISHSTEDERVDFTMFLEGSTDQVPVLTPEMTKRRKHGDKTPYMCSICKRVFSNLYTMKRHLGNHSRTFSCIVCDEKFHRVSEVYKHRLKHPGAKLFKCSVCGKEFGSPIGFRSHMIDHNGAVRIKCTYCSYVASNRSGLASHMVSHRPPTMSKRIPCEYCGKLFARKKSVALHVAVVHKIVNNLNLYDCKICDRRCSSPAKLKAHIEFQHNKYPCPICTKRFTEEADRNIHVKEKHFNADLNEVHQDKRHSAHPIKQPSEKPLVKAQCDECGKTMKCEGSLARHMRYHKEIVPVPCPICGVRVKYLDSHMQAHNGIKRLSCQICQERFKWSSQVKNHMLKNHSFLQSGDTGKD